MRYTKPMGWRGHSHEHYLARKGIRTKKVDPIFLAQRREAQMPSAMLMQLVRSDMTLQEITATRPDVDPEDVRRRGIDMIEAREQRGVLSRLDRMGVDEAVRQAQYDKTFKEEAMQTLENRQKASFLHPEKANALRRRIGAVSAS
jgi:hypothetical protein